MTNINPELLLLSSNQAKLSVVEQAYIETQVKKNRSGRASQALAAIEIMIGRVTGNATLYHAFPFEASKELMRLTMNSEDASYKQKMVAYSYYRQIILMEEFVKSVLALNKEIKALYENPDILPWVEERQAKAS